MLNGSRYLFVFALVLLSAYTAFAQALQTVYDGRVEPNPHRPSHEVLQILRRYALSGARQAWRNDKYCTEGFEAIDVANGSFTKANSSQNAILYRYCVKGQDIGNNGIAIIKNQRVVAHVVFNSGEDYSIQALSDINGNGLSEIVIGDGSSHQGYSASLATVIEISSSGVDNLGTADVFQDDCGANPDRCETIAYKVLVKTGTTPIFYRETYKKAGNRWIKSGVAVRYTLRKNESKFRQLN